MPSKAKKPLKLLFVAAEDAPFAKVGGLGEVMYALPRALRQLGHDVRVFMPKYARIGRRRIRMEKIVHDLRLMRPEHDPYGLTVANVLQYNAKDGAITYFLENMEYYEKRANVYGYVDDAARWVLLSRGVLEFLKRSEWKPDVIVANDWPAGFIPNLMATVAGNLFETRSLGIYQAGHPLMKGVTEYKHDPVISRIASAFVIHNLAYQGMFDVYFLKDEDYDSGTEPLPDPLGKGVIKLNGMRRGVRYADVISTVSPTYAREILTPEFGERMDDVLRKRQDRLYGIRNGMDYDKFNPLTDPIIAARYHAKALDVRVKNKTALQRMFKLNRDPDKFIVGFVGRLDEQKGIRLFMQNARQLFENLDFQFVLVGTGEKDFRMFFRELQEEFPGRIGAHLYFDEKLPKHIFAGADAILMPSRFEPAGLVQIEAMRYGCIPIVRKTGGLADTVEDYWPGRGQGTGFVFNPYEPTAMLIALVRAWQAYRNKREWRAIVRRAMAKDFSWDASARAHVELYRTAIRFHRASTRG